MTRNQTLRLIEENLKNGNAAEKILTELELQGLVTSYPIEKSMEGKTQAIFVLGITGPNRLIARPTIEPCVMGQTPEPGFLLRYPTEETNAEVRFPIACTTFDATEEGLEKFRQDLQSAVNMACDDYARHLKGLV